MNLLPASLHYRLRWLKRRVVNWRGDGVHSPQAYQLLRGAPNRRYTYYAFRHLRTQRADRLQSGGSTYDQRRSMTRARMLERLFWLICQLGVQRVLLLASDDSLIPLYLESAGVRSLQRLSNIPASLDDRSPVDLLLVEDFSGSNPQALEDLIRRLREGNASLLILLYTPTEKLYGRARQLEDEVRPQLTIDYLGMQLWFCDPRLTPSRNLGWC